jgi:hypothetical protein
LHSIRKQLFLDFRELLEHFRKEQVPVERVPGDVVSTAPTPPTKTRARRTSTACEAQ